MTARARVIAILLVTACLVVGGAAPAFAPFQRTAAEAVNVTEACPHYLSFEVVSMDPDPGPPPTVTIQAYSPPPTATSPGRLVLNRTVRVQKVDPELAPTPDGDKFPFHGRAVLRWERGPLAPGAKVVVGPPDVFGDDAMDSPVKAKVSQRCDTPGLRLDFVRSQSTAQVLTWRVRNPNPTAVEFNAELLTRPAEVELGTAPPNGEVTFQTDRVPGPNIVLLFVGGKLVNLGVAL